MTHLSFLLENQQTGIVAGCDEAGCGPWAGPVVAGAVILRRDSLPEGFLGLLNDSKKLTIKQRVAAYEALIQHQGAACWIGVGSASVEEIDSMNIRRAAYLAMARAIDALASKPEYVLVDGTGLPPWSYPSQAVVKGDQKSYSIAAASIIAKVTRDRLMDDLARTYPAYGWSQNAGYGTKMHQEAIAQNGITPHHRQSFAPIKAYLLRTA